MNPKIQRGITQLGFTLVEMLMVVVIMGVLSSLFIPRFALLVQKAYEAKAKSNLAYIRSAIRLYQSDLEGVLPLRGYPPGDTHYTAFGQSLTAILAPRYLSNIQVPFLSDYNPTYNGLSVGYDLQAAELMGLTPPKDVFIIPGPPGYTAMLNSPFVYDNETGAIYYSNGNYDLGGGFFYNW